MKPKPLYLENLATSLARLAPADLLQTQFVPGDETKFNIIGEDRVFRVRSSGWAAPNRSGPNSWGEALSGYGANEIEFNISVTDLAWRVRAFYRNGVFVGLQYEAEPWERDFIVPGSASYEAGFYTLGESFYNKIGSLADDAVESLYNTKAPDWWASYHPDYPWPEELVKITDSLKVHLHGNSMTIRACSVDEREIAKTIVFQDGIRDGLINSNASDQGDVIATVDGSLMEYDITVKFGELDTGLFAVGAKPMSMSNSDVKHISWCDNTGFDLIVKLGIKIADRPQPA